MRTLQARLTLVGTSTWSNDFEPSANHTKGDLMFRNRVAAPAVVVAAFGAGVLAAVGLASAPPVGPLPAGPSSTIKTTKGQLVAFALPHRSGGRVWRLARAPKLSVLRQVSEADVGNHVVLVYVATGHDERCVRAHPR
jgi:hypothetical protein